MSSQTSATTTTELVGTFQSRLNGATVRIAARNAVVFVELCKSQTAGGWRLVAVEERARKSYAKNT